MTFEQFREKLTPFFTPEQIGNLDRAATESAIDGFSFGTTLEDIKAMKEEFSAGRDLMCEVIADYIESDPAFIEKLAGSPISWERRKALIMQFDIEW